MSGFRLICVLLVASISSTAPASLFKKNNPETLKFVDPLEARTLTLYSKTTGQQNMAKLINLLLRYPVQPKVEIVLEGIVLLRAKDEPDRIRVNVMTSDREFRVDQRLDYEKLQKGEWIDLNHNFKSGMQGFNLNGTFKLAVRWADEKFSLKNLSTLFEIATPWGTEADSLQRPLLTAKRAQLERKQLFSLKK